MSIRDEIERIEQSNDIAYKVIEVAQNKAPSEFVTLDFRYGIADALWDAGYRKVEQANREPSERLMVAPAIQAVRDVLDGLEDWEIQDHALEEIRSAVDDISDCESATAVPHEEHGEPSDETQVYVGAQDIAFTYDKNTGDLRVRFRHGDYERTLEASCAPPTIADRLVDESGADREPSAYDEHALRLQALGIDQFTLDALEMTAQVGMPPERIRDNARAFAAGRADREPSDDEVRVMAEHMAHAALDWNDIETDGHSHSLTCTNWRAYEDDARAALIAAQEVRRG